MAGPRVYDDADIRDVVAAMEHPSVATRGDTVVAVNDALASMLGIRREELEGQPVTKLMPEPERERLLRRALLPDDHVAFAEPLRTLVKTKDGGVLAVRSYTSRFPAREKPDYRVALVAPEPPEETAPLVGRDLLALSAELIGAASASEVRGRTRAAFARAGLEATFWRPGDPPGDVQPDAARRALDGRTPVFSGTGSAADAVYVPLDDEVLRVCGPRLSGHQAFLFGFVGKLVATALLDALASEAAQRRLDDTRLVLQLARTTSESLDLEVVLELTADSLVKLLQVASCFILLHDEEAGVLRGGASSNERRDVVKDIVIPLSDPNSIAARAARERQVIFIADASRDPLALRSPHVAAFGETALAALPMLSRGRLEGVVILDETRGPRTFSKEWIELAAAMVAQVGLSITNARLYESLRRSYEEVAATRAAMVRNERLAGLGELAAIVAHEVRNPLGVIYNATNSLRRMVEGSAEGVTLVDIVREECERLNEMVGDLLDFARPRKLSLRSEDLERLLGEIVEVLGTADGVRFELEVEHDLPPALLDRRMMRQALLNVALNGVQAMPRGGTLHLSARLEEPGRLAVDIRDEGPGISDADLPRIFEPFFTTKATGAGLGLAVVKRIVEDHGGDVSAATSPGGTTFHFRLPVAPAK
jgi:two-component system sensor histidine kinase HydH